MGNPSDRNRDVSLPKAVSDQLLAEALDAHPNECCGLLLGANNQITSIQPANNIHPAPQTHFEIDPQSLIAAHRAARQGGPEIIGYYHSHPTGAARPSATDQAGASADRRIWAIIAGAEFTFWCDLPDGFAPLSYSVVSQ